MCEAYSDLDLNEHYKRDRVSVRGLHDHGQAGDSLGGLGTQLLGTLRP